MFMVAGLVCNFWILQLFSPDGRIENNFFKFGIHFIDAVLIGWGLLTVRFADTDWVRSTNLTLLSFAILTPILGFVMGEAMLRVSIAAGAKRFRAPGLYAYELSEDDYWKLFALWDEPFAPDRIHPTLGWSQTYVTETNPLGLEERTLRQLHSNNSKILFYGDSFIKGKSDEEFQIPRFMTTKLPGTDVIDMGVGGYGTDQILLLFKETHRLVENPLILLGNLTFDMDRAALTIRGPLKPYFDVNDATMVPKGPPFARDQKPYLREHPPAIKSYLLALLRRKFSDPDTKQNLIESVNAKIMAEVKSIVDREKLRLFYVIFYDEAELTTTRWREKFMRSQLERLQLPYISTKEILLKYAETHNVPLSAFYKQGDAHHNNLGNQVISEGIADYLKANDLLNPASHTEQSSRAVLSSDRAQSVHDGR